MSLSSKQNRLQEFVLNENLVLVNQSVNSREEVLSQLAKLLQENGYVKSSFSDALLKREKEFPTGLQTASIGVAIPHTDNDHVIRPAVAIATLTDPIDFQAMASPQEVVPVSIVLMLAIHKPEAQLKILQSVIEMIQDDEVLARLQSAPSKTELVSIVQDHLNL